MLSNTIVLSAKFIVSGQKFIIAIVVKQENQSNKIIIDPVGNIYVKVKHIVSEKNPANFEVAAP